MGRSAGLRDTTIEVSKVFIQYDNFAHLVHDVFERVGTIDGEADEEEICLRVRKRSQAVVLFLSRSVPQSKLYRFPRRTVSGLGNVILEYGRYVFLLQKSDLVHFSHADSLTSGK